MPISNHRSGRWLIIIGLILIIMGFIFQLQSISLIGPSTSFMYSNHDWTFYGLAIIGIGATAILIGLYLKIRKNKNL